MRTLSIATAFLAIASAFLLYGLNYDTRLMEARVREQERKADIARSDIAVLKADRAHLSRPDRIEPMARAQGLRPTAPSQFAQSDATHSTGTGATPTAKR